MKRKASQEFYRQNLQSLALSTSSFIFKATHLGGGGFKCIGKSDKIDKCHDFKILTSDR